MNLDTWYESTCAAESDIKAHLPTLSEYASKCKHVTEFGVRYGTSTCALMHGRPRKLVSYDTHQLIPVSQYVVTARQAGVDFEFIQGNVLLLTIEPTDMLFIDTLHNYGQMSAELARHWDKVWRFLAFHDTVSYGRHGMDGRPVGVLDAIEEFMKIHPEWELVHDSPLDHGFRVYERKAA